MQGSSFPDPFTLIIFLVLLSLAPFMAMMVTSFVKLVVVLYLIRNALGIQQIPPNLVLNGLAIILTIYIMAPVGQEVFDTFKHEKFSRNDLASYSRMAEKAKGPFQKFLKKHTQERERVFFVKSAKALWPEKQAKEVNSDDLLILVPAFTVSELTSAFQIGLLLYLPFIAIDLIVSNILMAMGMMMVSPMTISLPFKLLLFVLLDGWTRMIHGLVLTYK
ncbi:MAG: type III secretion system export apparatus subunit SctR [Pseudomonadota bacterium]